MQESEIMKEILLSVTLVLVAYAAVDTVTFVAEFRNYSAYGDKTVGESISAAYNLTFSNQKPPFDNSLPCLRWID
jgi:hypothetical protein